MSKGGTKLSKNWHKKPAIYWKEGGSSHFNENLTLFIFFLTMPLSLTLKALTCLFVSNSQPGQCSSLNNKHSATFSSERVISSCSPNFEMSISRQDNSQSIQTLLSGKQPLNSPSHLKRELSAYSLLQL